MAMYSHEGYGKECPLGGEWAGSHNCWVCKEWRPVR